MDNAVDSTSVSALPPEQQQELQAQLANPSAPGSPVQTPQGDDLVDSLTPEELADVSIQTKGEGFDPARWAVANLKTAPPDKLQKAADAHALLVSRGFNWRDIDLGKSVKGVGEVFKGVGKYSARALELGVVNPVASLVLPKPGLNEQKQFEKERTAKSAELVAATESAQFGLGEMLRKGAGKLSRLAGKAYQALAVDPTLMPSFMKDPLDQTPKERLDSLWNEAGILQQKENISRGHGAVADTVLGKAISDMEAAGGKVDPKAVEEMAAGDPITFAAFGEGFKVGTAVVGAGGRAVLRSIATFTSKVPAVEAMAALQAAQKAMAQAGAAAKGAESASEAAGADIARTAEAVTASEGALSATEGPFQPFSEQLKVSPVLAADLNAAATAANAARKAEMASAVATQAVESARQSLVKAEARVAATPGTGLVTKAGQMGKQAVVAKNAVSAAAAGTTERAADIALGFVPGAVGVAARTAEAVGKTVQNILPPIATPHYIRILTGKLGKVAEGSFEKAGQLMRGDVRNYAPGVGAASSAVQAVPTIAAEAGKGFAVDAALAAVTSETPQDTANMPVFMSAFGAVRGLAKGTARGVERQLIGARNVESDSGSASRPYNRFSALDAANKFAVDQAEDPDITKRLSAVRDFNKDTGAQMYWVPEEASVKKILQRYLPGLDEARYDEMANQQAVYLTLKDDAGQSQKVGIFRDLDAAPHESGHAAQDVLGERAMRGIDDLVYNEYAPVWDAVGDNYARRFFDSQHLADAAARGEGWQEAVIDLSLGTADWRGKLTPLEIIGMSNHYLAREISAEGFDAIFKHGGPELLDNNSLPGKLARILGKTLVGMGVEPFQEFRTEGQSLPVSLKTAEALRSQFRTGMKEARVEAARPDLTNVPAYGMKKGKPAVVTPRGGPPSPPEAGGIPIAAPKPPPTPKDAADEARGFVPEVPDAPAVRGGRSQKAVLEDIADAIEKRTGLVVDYMSAPGEPAGAVTSQRIARRAVIEMFRTMPPEARALFEKQFVPEQVVTVGGGKLQVMGWAPEVFAANAHKLAKALADAKSTRLSPYEIDKKTGSFTDRGWRELFVDATNFSRNQQQGLTGAGKPLVVPAGVVEKGFFAPTPEGEPGFPLDQRKADLLSALFGIPVPKTPRIGKVYPRNLAGQEVSAATMPGRVSAPVVPREPFSGPKAAQMGIEGRTLNEVNPFRAELQAKGIKPDFIEALQRLNLENIADVSAKPADATEIRGKEFTLQAGFQPKKDEPRAIKGAAIQLDQSGKIFEGTFHGDAYEKAFEDGSLKEGPGESVTEGYVTNAGEFLDRNDAEARAIELKQLSKRDVKAFQKEGNVEEGYGLEAATFMTARKFQPKKNEPKAIKEAATRYHPSGNIYTGAHHGETAQKALAAGEYEKYDNTYEEPGFVTNAGEFLTRDQALKRAQSLDQIPAQDAKEMKKIWGGAEAIYFDEVKRFQPKLSDVPPEKRGEGKEVTVRRPDGSTYQAMDKGPAEGFENGEIVTRRAIGIPIAGKDGVVKMNHGLMPKDHQIVTAESPAFQPGTKGYIGDLEAGEITAKWADLSAKNHLTSGMNVGKGNWRYNPNTKMVYWWDKPEHEVELDTVKAWLEGKGHEVKGHVQIETLGHLSSGLRFNEAHGKDIPADAKFQPKPNEDVQKIAADYARTAGMTYRPAGAPVNLDVEHAKKLADFYEAAKHDPTNPEVKSSYDALIAETLAQYNQLKKAGYVIEPFDKGDPYKTADEMADDIRDNKHLFILPTSENFSEPADYPLLRPFGKDGLDTLNDVFRGVHDIFGHARVGSGFDAGGELNAWKSHRQMYSPEAQGALATETIGQNSWNVFGPHLRDKTGKIMEPGDKGYVPTADQPYAKQKATVVPQELIDETTARFSPKEEKQKYVNVRNPVKSVLFKTSDFVGPMSAEKAKEFSIAARKAGTNRGEYLTKADILDAVPEGVNVFTPEEWARFATKKKDKIVDLEHRSSAEGLAEVDPAFFGKGKATPLDLRGGNKSFFFVKGSDLGQDEPIFGKHIQLNNYKGSIPERELYDLRKGQPDPLKWRQTLNREEADTNVEKAGYSGIILDTADGRQVVALFKKIPVTQFQTAKRGEQEMLPGISAKRAPLTPAEQKLIEGVKLLIQPRKLRETPPLK